MLYLPAVMHQSPTSPRRTPRRGGTLWRGETLRRLAGRVWLVLVALALLAPRALDSHEIPERVTVRAWSLPAGDSLRLYVRVPLEAMRDLDFPLRPDGALDFVAVRDLLPEAAQLWIADAIGVEADGSRAQVHVRATRLALPDDRSFDSPDAAAASFARAALGDSISIPWQQVLLDVALVVELPRPDAAVTLTPALARLGVRTTTILGLVDAAGDTRTLTYLGDPGRIALQPRWWQSAVAFLGEGFSHILGGLDHLLFVFCLVLPIRRWRPLVGLVTAFTVAHSLTLGAAALGLVPTALWFPPLVETLIAASILWLTVENVLRSEAQLERRWVMAFAFGLIHGFGFSFALSEQLQFAGGNLLAALASFNVGVELGQLLVLAVALPALELLRRAVPEARRHLIVWVGSAFVAHTALHWMQERWADFAAHEISLAWPTLDATFALHAMRVALLASLALALALALRQILRRLVSP